MRMGIRCRCIECFGKFYSAQSPSGHLPLAGLWVPAANSQIGETPPSTAELKEAVRKMEVKKAGGVYIISAEMLKAGSEAMIHGSDAVLSDVWQSDAIALDLKRGLVSLSGKEMGTDRTEAITVVLHCSVCRAK